MSPVKVRVRGIYTTALTLLLSERFEIVDPSEVIQLRLGLSPVEGSAEVSIFDRPDRHGVVVEGVREMAEEVVGFLRTCLPWAIFIPKGIPQKDSPMGVLAGLLARFEGEFPKPTKDFLDQVRGQKVSTIPGHHLLKTIDPAKVDEAEAKADPERLGEIGHALWEELVGSHYTPGKTVTIWHLKAGEEPIRQTGEVVECTEEKLVLRRRFRPGGTYDGLGLAKEEGDYGFVELRPDQWWGRRLYFRAQGFLLGEIYNIHTPPELLPGEVRYLDLEVDLVRKGKEVALIDEEKLREKEKNGLLSGMLAERALSETYRILKMLS